MIMKMKKSISIFMSIVLLLSCFSIASFAVSGNVPADIIEMSSKVAVELEQEGIVLLKNEDNVLPLNGKKVNIFGAGSVVPFLGGAGSGAITTDDPVTFYEALDENNIEYNTELRSLYEKECSGNETPKTSNTVLNNLLQLVLASSSLEEMPCDKLTDDIMTNAVKYSDTAIIVISRTSRETADLPAEVLRLSEEEKKRRIMILVDAQNEINREKSKRYAGATVEILVEDYDEKKNFYQGRDEFGRMIYFNSSENLIGKFINVTVVETGGISLKGEIVR